MASLMRRFLALALLLAVVRSGTSSSHSLRYFYTALSEPGHELPQFSIVGYVDNQPFTKYDSILRRDVPLVPWMEKIGKEDPQYWETQSQISQGAESLFRVDLETLRGRYNQSRGGLHTWQLMYGCEVGLDGRLHRGHYQFAYDGEDFIALDTKTHSWTARAPQALPTKSRWENEVHYAQLFKSYLEEECVESLMKYLDFGKEALKRTERPTARVARKEGYDGRETLFCELYGFYPKEIEVTWMKGGEDQKPETFTGGVVPNSDGTYHTWLSINVDPKEKDRYRCRVEHDSLKEETLDLSYEEPASYVGLIVGVLVGVLLAVILLGAGVAIYMKKRSWPKSGYKAPPVSEA